VFFLAMVVVGFVIPSPGIAGNPGTTGDSRYQPLSKPSNPELLLVPDIGLKAPIVPIDIQPDGVLDPPADVHEVGWWTGSAKPGATSGQTLITGHTVHTGGGVMNALGDLRPGSLVRIRTPRGTVDYEATKVFVYTKAEVAEHRAELFSQKRQDYRLVLVTCTGWNGHEYESNIIVFADQLGVRTDSQKSDQKTDQKKDRKAGRSAA
jgi:LPXTG-site transpeptidase (sortase) family protein